MEDSAIARQWRGAFEDSLGEVPRLIEEGDRDGVYRVMHDAKGLGPTFGYGLVGEIAKVVGHRLRSEKGPISENDRALVLAGHAALSFVMSKDIKGDGGEAGEQILAKIKSIAEM